MPLPSRSMGDICKCKQLFWTVPNSFFHQTLLQGHLGLDHSLPHFLHSHHGTLQCSIKEQNFRRCLTIRFAKHFNLRLFNTPPIAEILYVKNVGEFADVKLG